MKVLLLWRTDSWHSVASKELVGVFDDKSKMLRSMVQADASSLQIRQVAEYGQSQGCYEDYEFEIEEVNINENLL